MASNYTNQYKLCQWEEDDRVDRLEFNQDNARVEEGMVELGEKLELLQEEVEKVGDLEARQESIQEELREVAASVGDSYSENNSNFFTRIVEFSGGGADVTEKVPFVPQVMLLSSLFDEHSLFTGVRMVDSCYGTTTYSENKRLTYNEGQLSITMKTTNLEGGLYLLMIFR